MASKQKNAHKVIEGIKPEKNHAKQSDPRLYRIVFHKIAAMYRYLKQK